MRKGDYQQLLDGLAGIVASDDARRQFEDLIREGAARSGVALPVRPERVQFARRLLDAGTPRVAIRERLMARFDVGDSQAYRDISEALAISPKDRPILGGHCDVMVPIEEVS